MKVFSFDTLSTADLIVDAIYEGGSAKNVSDDPISKLLPGSGNQGGFRKVAIKKKPMFVVLYSSSHDPDWPDFLDIETGQYVYYGDNKKPGHELHDTPKKGNIILKDSFDILHSEHSSTHIPIFLIFEKHPTANSARSVRFRGAAVPGYEGLSYTQDLVAIWKSKEGQRFQNYLAKFTVLDINTLTRDFIRAHSQGNEVDSKTLPSALSKWWQNKTYTPLKCQKVSSIRKKEEQLPKASEHVAMLGYLHSFFKNTPTSFEYCAARIYQLSEPSNVFIDEITRGTVDGGIDAIGRYRLGVITDPIYVDFFLEAKCYSSSNSVGVKETSRLISRIRNRQFGVLVTTSYVAQQAYQEIRDDGHPIVIISGSDIIDILCKSNISTVDALKEWLETHF